MVGNGMDVGGGAAGAPGTCGGGMGGSGAATAGAGGAGGCADDGSTTCGLCVPGMAGGGAVWYGVGATGGVMTGAASACPGLRGRNPSPSPRTGISCTCLLTVPPKDLSARTQATTLKISSIEVRPICAFIQPSMRSGIIPCVRAVRAMSAAEARSTARRSISSVTAMTSCTAIRPR